MAQQGIYVSPDNIVPNMVKASNANDAEQILKTNMYNGTQSEYLVTKTEEIVIPPCCGLMAEQNVEFFNNN